MVKKRISFILTIVLLISGSLSSVAQTNSYRPKGDPGEWNFELTPFLWGPVTSGEVTSKRLSEDFQIPAIDLLSKLKMAFMISAEVSKGNFFLNTTYLYTKLGTEEVVWTSKNGEKTIVAAPYMKMNIVEVITGGRFRMKDSFILDPFVGFRYTDYQIYGSIDGIADTTSFDERTGFWDPVIGVQMHYFPHPRVPIIVKADIGGLGAGSKFSWSTSVNSGYTLSPSFDLLAGFVAYGADYETENAAGNNIGLNIIMYGFDFGIKYHIPGRAKDKAIFRKFE